MCSHGSVSAWVPNKWLWLGTFSQLYVTKRLQGKTPKMTSSTSDWWQAHSRLLLFCFLIITGPFQARACYYGLIDSLWYALRNGRWIWCSRPPLPCKKAWTTWQSLCGTFGCWCRYVGQSDLRCKMNMCLWKSTHNQIDKKCSTEESMFDESLKKLTLSARFPIEYPMSPPEASGVWGWASNVIVKFS